MGILLGLFSSATFGLIPLFTLPLLHAGITTETALTYRFVIAVIIMWPILFLKKERFAIRVIDLLKIMGLSTFYLLAVLLFFHAFNFLPSGVVALVQFLYPVMVMLIMVLFFHEHFHWYIAFAIALGIAGVALLSSGPGLETNSAAINPDNSNIFWGITLSLLAGLFNALYFVGIQVARIPNINGLVLTFYVMLFGAIFCFSNAIITNSLQWIHGIREISLAFLLALVTAVISNFTLILAIKKIGSTITSILGVMEPLTAVTVGIFVFNEPFNSQLIGGIAFIVLSVFLVMLGPKLFTKKAT